MNLQFSVCAKLFYSKLFLPVGVRVMTNILNISLILYKHTEFVMISFDVWRIPTVASKTFRIIRCVVKSKAITAGNIS